MRTLFISFFFATTLIADPLGFGVELNRADHAAHFAAGVSIGLLTNQLIQKAFPEQVPRIPRWIAGIVAGMAVGTMKELVIDHGGDITDINATWMGAASVGLLIIPFDL